ncbi:MAG: Hsp20/alpha crystallin family protein [Bacteroidia bacterium]|nr:Hsp20/alpha crystallin family protein [Bacteroidia bacterium]
MKTNFLSPRISKSFWFPQLYNEFVTKATQGFYPAVDILETPEQFELHVSAPGFEKSDLNLSIEQNRLTISGERKLTEKEEGKTWKRIESHYGAFSRSFTLTDNINKDQIKASYQNGILTVVLPKQVPESKAVSKIEIE